MRSSREMRRRAEGILRFCGSGKASLLGALLAGCCGCCCAADSVPDVGGCGSQLVRGRDAADTLSLTGEYAACMAVREYWTRSDEHYMWVEICSRFEDRANKNLEAYSSTHPVSCCFFVWKLTWITVMFFAQSFQFFV
jgi:hypothetical protein